MGLIYLITNKINNKKYVGKTERSLQERWEEHKRHIYTVNYPLYLAMRKYGLENFSIEVIENNIPSELINEKEICYIQKYKSLTEENGYNVSLGGEGMIKYDIETMYALWQEGYTGKEIERKMGIGRTNLVLNRLKGAGLITDEDIAKRVSEFSKKKNADPVLQFDLDGNFIREYSSASEAGRINGWSSSNIRSCCRGEMKTAYHYIWKRKYEKGPQRQ